MGQQKIHEPIRKFPNKNYPLLQIKLQRNVNYQQVGEALPYKYRKTHGKIFCYSDL